MNRLTDWMRRVVVRTWRITSFTLYMGYEFVASNLLVLVETLRPRGRAAPAIVALRLPGRSETEAVSMANLITLTPGTLTVEMFQDPPTLYVHGMFARDPDEFRRALLSLETRLLRAMRPVGQRDDRDPVDGGAVPEPPLSEPPRPGGPEVTP